MFVNLVLLALGVWGLYYTWMQRHTAGGNGFFDMASPVRNPIAYKFTIGLRLVLFGAGVVVSVYRLIFGITD